MTFTIAIYEARDGKDKLFDRMTLSDKTPCKVERSIAYLNYCKNSLSEFIQSLPFEVDSFYYLKLTAFGIVIPVALADEFINSLTPEKVNEISMMVLTYFTQR